MLNTRRVRAISIDLDDTLWPVRPTLERAHDSLCRWLDARAPGAAALLRDRDFVAAARQGMALRQPSISHDVSAMRRQLIAGALAQAGADAALMEPAFALYYAQRQQVTLFADAEPALAHLARRYRLVALTNGNADIHAIGLGRYFHASISATDVGAAKPDAAIFRAAADAVGARPKEILHIGDDPHMDGLGALQSGMQMAWINRAQAAWPFASGPQPQLVTHDLEALRQML